MHLVVGATGSLGSDICRRLRSRGHDVRGLVRPSSNPDTVSALRQMGVETVEGDLRDPASLEPACNGADVIISTVTSIRSRQSGDSFAETDTQGQANLIDAAARSGVKRFVYISFSGNLGGDDPLTVAKRSTEEKLQNSGIHYTILRPSLFMEVWLSPHLGFDYPNAKAVIFGTGLRPLSWISQGDVAELAVLTSISPDAENSIIELGGPAAVNPLDVVTLFEQIGGRPFTVEHVPEEALQAQLQAADNELAKTFAALQLKYAGGDEISMTETLKRFPVKMKSVRDYAIEVLGGGES
ncbi:MAG TPA: SDR family oxidoreductase [Thermoanaerobaculia bacterium]|nr:SDR family oxidoreductase [Thermoanaerobaculia bacterium]